MIRYLLDTHVVSELVRPVPHARVVAFVAGLASPMLSVITIHELSFGAERTADPVRKAKLIAWIASLCAQFVGRVIEVDVDIAEQAGRLRALAAAQGHAVESLDALIAASALACGASVATRNVRDFVPLGVPVFDPWTGERPTV